MESAAQKVETTSRSPKRSVAKLGRKYKPPESHVFPMLHYHVLGVKSCHLSPVTTTDLLVWPFEELGALNFHCKQWAWSE